MFPTVLKGQKTEATSVWQRDVGISDFVTFFITGAEGAQQEAGSETREFRNLRARITLG